MGQVTAFEAITLARTSPMEAILRMAAQMAHSQAIQVVEDSHDSPAREDLDTDEGYKVVYRYELDGRTYFDAEWINCAIKVD